MITARATSPVMLEVLRNRFQAIAEEMASLVLRAGHTVFVKETSDFGAALVSTDGEVICAPVNTGVGGEPTHIRSPAALLLAPRTDQPKSSCDPVN